MIYSPQPKILKGGTKDEIRISKEALFKGVSTQFGLRTIERCVENPHYIFCSSFQNLRLGEHGFGSSFGKVRLTMVRSRQRRSMLRGKPARCRTNYSNRFAYVRTRNHKNRHIRTRMLLCKVHLRYVDGATSGRFARDTDAMSTTTSRPYVEKPRLPALPVLRRSPPQPRCSPRAPDRS
jgi:hypothetical protein